MRCNLFLVVSRVEFVFYHQAVLLSDLMTTDLPQEFCAFACKHRTQDDFDLSKHSAFLKEI